MYYNEKSSIDQTEIEFAKILGEILKKYNPIYDLIIPIITHDHFFRIAKQICSSEYFHSQVISSKKFDEIVVKTLRSWIEKGSNSNEIFNEFINRLKAWKKFTREEKQFITFLSNIVFSIYVEYCIQRSVCSKNVPEKLTWSLKDPADGEGKTLYLGYDVSRNVREGSGIAVIFVVYDAYGNMVNATTRTYPGEKVSEEHLRDALLHLIAHAGREMNVNRLVLYKDGPLRSAEEAEKISMVLQSVGQKAGFNRFDIIGIVKRHNLRLFRRGGSNPARGTWVKIWNISRHGVLAERALIVSSEVKAGGTVKPVLIERYRIPQSSNKRIEDLISEYLRLCRLNFWNPLDGASKYPLPVLMADKLSYLSLLGVDIKTP
ncbi:MAG: hypothetical protein QXY59_04335 [Candidatus Korarchaeota archaeon]